MHSRKKISINLPAKKSFPTSSISLLSVPGESVFLFLYLATNGVVTCSEAESTCWHCLHYRTQFSDVTCFL